MTGPKDQNKKLCQENISHSLAKGKLREKMMRSFLIN